MDISDIGLVVVGFIVGVWVMRRQHSADPSHPADLSTDEADQTLDDLIQSVERNSRDTIRSFFDDLEHK